MMATATGAYTEKGQLIQKILFPSPIAFIFDEHLKVVIAILLLWSLLVFVISVLMMGQHSVYSWFYGYVCLFGVLSVCVCVCMRGGGGGVVCSLGAHLKVVIAILLLCSLLVFAISVAHYIWGGGGDTCVVVGFDFEEATALLCRSQ